MTDIEIKRKELETAKRIRAEGYSCHALVPYVSCYNAPCPSNGEEKGCLFRSPADWDAFITTREAELAALDKAQESLRGDGNAGPRDGLSHVQTAPHDGLTHEERVRALYGEAFRRTTPSPTLDDFALALIQGGYFNMTMGEDAAVSNLISRAGKIKDALDARRGS